MLTSGAGLGSRWMTFSFKDRDFCLDVEDIARAFMAAVDAERSDADKA